jgi:hypothetical protein
MDRHYRLIGEGHESAVYAYDRETVIKISPSPHNLRGEYIIFSDPTYRDMTPEVYDHGPDWQWMAVERVQPLDEESGWDRIFKEFLPGAARAFGFDRTDRVMALRKLLKDLQLKVNHTHRQLKIFENLPPDEREWIEGIIEMYNALGLPVADIDADNLGITRGHLVVIDINTMNVGDQGEPPSP